MDKTNTFAPYTAEDFPELRRTLAGRVLDFEVSVRHCYAGAEPYSSNFFRNELPNWRWLVPTGKRLYDDLERYMLILDYSLELEDGLFDYGRFCLIGLRRACRRLSEAFALPALPANYSAIDDALEEAFRLTDRLEHKLCRHFPLDRPFTRIPAPDGNE